MQTPSVASISEKSRRRYLPIATAIFVESVRVRSPPSPVLEKFGSQNHPRVHVIFSRVCYTEIHPRVCVILPLVLHGNSSQGVCYLIIRVIRKNIAGSVLYHHMFYTEVHPGGGVVLLYYHPCDTRSILPPPSNLAPNTGV